MISNDGRASSSVIERCEITVQHFALTFSSFCQWCRSYRTSHIRMLPSPKHISCTSRSSLRSSASYCFSNSISPHRILYRTWSASLPIVVNVIPTHFSLYLFRRGRPRCITAGIPSWNRCLTSACAFAYARVPGLTGKVWVTSTCSFNSASVETSKLHCGHRCSPGACKSEPRYR